jgi:GNAT superfamily N-acetyltransferase
VEALTAVINRAYAAGEAGLWVEGWSRIAREEVADMVRDGAMLVARDGERIVGCASVRPLDAATAELGLVSALPGDWGGGVGRALVRFAEDLARARGIATMQLELLVPRDGTHPHKERLRAWYERLGYRVVRAAPFEEIASHGPAELAKPCEFLVFEKPLAREPRR